MALECKGRCHAARRVSSSHECIMDFDRQRRCRTGIGVSFFFFFLFWVDKGRSKAGSARRNEEG